MGNDDAARGDKPQKIEMVLLIRVRQAFERQDSPPQTPEMDRPHGPASAGNIYSCLRLPSS